MKVIQLCPMFPYHGGVERHVFETSRKLQERGIDVEVYATDPTGKLPKLENVEGITVHRFRSFAPNNVYFFAPKLFSALKEVNNVDIIHAHTYQAYPSLAAALAKKQNKVPLVFTPHFHPVGGTLLRSALQKIYGILGGYTFDQADVIIAVSRYERSILSFIFGVDQKKIACVPNGVDVNKFNYSYLKCKSSKQKIVLYVGRLEKYKGVQYLIHAFTRINKEHPDSKLIVVGAGVYNTNLITLVNKLGLRDKVIFLKNVSESKLLQVYASSDVFVMLSEYEAFGISVVEAMASCIPVVVTKVGGISEIVQNGYNGFLVDYPPDVEAVSELVTNLLRHEDLSSKIGINARKTVFDLFTLDQTVRGLLDIYYTLVNRGVII